MMPSIFRKSSASSSNQNENITHNVESSTVNSGSSRITVRTEKKTQYFSIRNHSSMNQTRFFTDSSSNVAIDGLSLTERNWPTSEFPISSLRPIAQSSSSSTYPYPYKVKKSSQFYDNQTNRIPVYETHSKDRGTALILNNVKFHKDNLYRRGAEKDEKDLIDVLKQIGFRVENHQNLTSSKLRDILSKFPKREKSMKGDICMVVVMSHGSNKDIPGGYTEVLCSDGRSVTTDAIIDYFDETKSIYSKGKPKIFIFQCCRTGTQYDASPIKAKPSSKSNTLIAHSTIPGFSSLRHPENGTWYIQTLCKVLSEHAHQYHIEELLKIVDRDMNQIDSKLEQVSSYENRGFSRCYLHPR